MRQCHAIALICLSSSVLLGGCGSTYSLKEFAPVEGQPKSAFIDIKQRAVLSAKRPTSSANAGDVVMCAEPSPDAISSLASELALDTKYKDSLAATLGFAQQESAAYVGLRTQTIQLLRDGMYRLCEGYMSGALSPADYAWLSRRYQRNMVALLSIEQLTRVLQAPAAALSSQGMASAARSATAIQADLEEMDKIKARLDDEKKKINDELTEAQKLPDTDSSKAAKVKEIQKRLDDKQAAIVRADELRAALLEGLKSAKGILVSGSTSVQIIAASDPRLSVSDVVATKIADLTKQVLDQDDLPTLCFQLITGERAPNKSDSALQKLMASCAELVAVRVKQEVVRSEPVNFLTNPISVPGLEHFFDEVPPADDAKIKKKSAPSKKAPGK